MIFVNNNQVREKQSGEVNASVERVRAAEGDHRMRELTGYLVQSPACEFWRHFPGR